MKPKILCNGCAFAIKIAEDGFIMYQCELKLNPGSAECWGIREER